MRCCCRLAKLLPLLATVTKASWALTALSPRHNEDDGREAIRRANLEVTARLRPRAQAPPIWGLNEPRQTATSGEGLTEPGAVATDPPKTPPAQTQIPAAVAAASLGSGDVEPNQDDSPSLMIPESEQDEVPEEESDFGYNSLDWYGHAGRQPSEELGEACQDLRNNKMCLRNEPALGEIGQTRLKNSNPWTAL